MTSTHRALRKEIEALTEIAFAANVRRVIPTRDGKPEATGKPSTPLQKDLKVKLLSLVANKLSLPLCWRPG
jgi:hypothetical protein